MSGDRKKIELGDFQTPESFAVEVTSFLVSIGVCPDVVIEPTCGVGAFIRAAVKDFPGARIISGFDIQSDYVDIAAESVSKCGRDGVSVTHQDFFTKDWNDEVAGEEGIILFLGNPPWVNNSTLGAIGGKNLPRKLNVSYDKGMDAITGKSNFDISEAVILRLLDVLCRKRGTLAMLCKTSTARRVLNLAWRKRRPLCDAALYRFNAGEVFHVSVDACLFVVSTGARENFATVYNGFSLENRVSRFGMDNGALIADLDGYEQYRDLDGCITSVWRSGVKHDASKVMELNFSNGGFINGFGERCDVESAHIYPLCKSSDIANQRFDTGRYVLVTQKTPAGDTRILEHEAPDLWNYLIRHSDALDGRKSLVYRKRPRFSMFGIGGYTFSDWKVAIAGMYKDFRFTAVGPREGKPTLLDDTCYFMPCLSQDAAETFASMLNSDIAMKFLHSLAFSDAMRPVTVDILNRINFTVLAQRLGVSKNVERLIKKSESTAQLEFAFYAD